MASKTFDPATDIPTMNNKVIFITGGTTGLGKASILAFVVHSPAHIYFSGRNATSAKKTIASARAIAPSVPITFIKCDNSSMASVRAAASQFRAASSRLDILMLNAGIIATPPSVSEDGFEIQFATNFLGHALLIDLLIQTLLSTAALSENVRSPPRIIFLTSIAYKQAPASGIEFATLRSSQKSLAMPLVPGRPWSRYGQSKLADLLYSKALAKRFPQLTSVAVHPGIIKAGLFGHLATSAKLAAFVIATFGDTVPAKQGAWNQLWAATAQGVCSGEYYEPVGVEGKAVGNRLVKDNGLIDRLWEWTQGVLKEYE